MAITVSPFHGVNDGATNAVCTVAVSGLAAGDEICVFATYRNSQGISSITALGNAMTQSGATQDGNFLSSGFFRYTVTGGDPSSGNVVVTLSGTARQGVGVAVIRGHDTIGGAANATPVVGGTSITQNVASQAGSVVIAWGWLEGVATVTLGAGQTVIQNENEGNDTYFSSYEAGAATVTMSHSWTGGEDAWQSAFNITAAAGGGGGAVVSPYFFRRRVASAA